MSILPLRQDFVGGIAIVVVAIFAFWQSKDLALGTLGGMGPGMLPKSLAVLLGALGALLAANALVDRGPLFGRVSIRGPVFVLGAIAAFAISVRPGGLLVAGPLAIFIAACGSRNRDGSKRSFTACDDGVLHRSVQDSRWACRSRSRPGCSTTEYRHV